MVGVRNVGRMHRSLSLFFVPSEDPTALGQRLAAAAREHSLVVDSGLGLPVLLRTPHIMASFRDTETFSTRMFQTGILKGGLASLQGADHTRMRRIYNLFFTPRAVARYEDSITRPIAREVVERLASKGPVDLLDDFAVELPKRVISTLFGFSLEKLEENDTRVRAMFRGITRIGDPVAAAEAERAYHETLADLEGLIERERASPGPTLLGEIMRVMKDEGLATIEACQQVVLSLLLGGYETTIWLFANAVHALLAHPAALARVRREPALVVLAIEESMRWCPSNPGTIRLVEKKVSLPDLELEPGTVVYVAATAAHYDEALYPDPTTFDLDRRSTPLIFGGGPHFCVGAQLARMEARVGFGALLERFPELRADPEERPVFRYGVRESVAHGPDRLPALLQ